MSTVHPNPHRIPSPSSARHASRWYALLYCSALNPAKYNSEQAPSPLRQPRPKMTETSIISEYQAILTGKGPSSHRALSKWPCVRCGLTTWYFSMTKNLHKKGDILPNAKATYRHCLRFHGEKRRSLLSNSFTSTQDVVRPASDLRHRMHSPFNSVQNLGLRQSPLERVQVYFHDGLTAI